jgi:hypothetical protein
MPARQIVIDDEIGAISLAEAQEKKEEEKGKKDQEKAPESSPVQIPAGLSIARSADGYIFAGLRYQSKSIDPVELSGSLLDKGATKDLANWKTYSQTNSEKWCVIDTEIIYQMLFSACQLRNDPKHQQVVSELTAFLQGLLDLSKPYFSTLTTFNYHAGTKDATVSKLETALGPVADKRIEVPEFNKTNPNDYWSYLILPEERPESKLTKVKPIPKNAEPLLETLLGENYQHAGGVFSYFSPRRSGNLRESRLWTPTESNRDIGERFAVFGVSNCERFSLSTIDSFSYRRPALGVRLR